MPPGTCCSSRTATSRRRCSSRCVCQVCLYYADLYELRVVERPARALRPDPPGARRARRSSWPSSTSGSRRSIIGRGVFLVSSFSGDRVRRRVARSSSSGSRGASRRAERLLLVGTRPAAVSLARELFDRRQELGVEIVGFVDPDPARVGAAGHQSRRHRHDRGHSVDRPRARRRPRRRQPGRRARQAADGQAARDEARRA